MKTYSIRTNLPPDENDRLGMEIFRMWIDFAMGDAVIGGRRLGFPSGRYASAIKYVKEGPFNVAIYVNDYDPPEAGILESGHPRVDLKTKLRWNKFYPMHRFPGAMNGGKKTMAAAFAGSKTKLRRRGSSIQGHRPEVWAEARTDEFNGFAQITSHSSPQSWIIPAMPAYAPARHLAQLARNMAKSGGVNAAYA